MTLTPQQLGDVIADANDFGSFAESWHIIGNAPEARRCAVIARHARRRLRAHVRERRKRLRAALDAWGRNIIGRMLADQLLQSMPCQLMTLTSPQQSANANG